MTWDELCTTGAALVRDLDPSAMSVADVVVLRGKVSRLRASLGVAEAQLAAREAESARWRGSGAKTPAEHAARLLGTSVGDAARLLETGRRLAEQPELREAAVTGEVSLPQLHEIAACADAVADGDPEVAAETAQQLLEQVAKGSSLQELRRECGNRRAAADTDPEATRRRIREQRSKRYWVEADGTAHLQLRGPVEDFVGLELLIRDKREQIFQTNRRAKIYDKPDAVDYDAFHAVLADLTQPPAAGTEAEPVRAGGREAGAAAAGADRPDRAAAGATSEPTAPTLGSTAPRGPRTGSGRYRGAKILMRVDYDALLRGATQGGEVSEIVGLGPVPPSFTHDLLQGGAALALVATRGDTVHAVAHLGRGPAAATLLTDPGRLERAAKTRAVVVDGVTETARAFTPHQQTALDWRNPTCAVPGCGRTARLERNHEIPYSQTGISRLDSANRLCTHHHRLHTTRRWRFTPDGEFVPPDHPYHPDRQRDQRDRRDRQLDAG
jgi:hypothetical protein